VSDRFVVLGVGASRATWFSEVSRWAHAGSIPVEFVKCVSAEQLRARLRSGRPHSAALIDGDAPGIDRDLLRDAHDAGASVVVIDSRRDTRHWLDLGADSVLADTFGPEQLVDALRAHAALVPTTEWRAPEPELSGVDARGRLIAVCGPGGTGVSTLAIALAQHLARRRNDPAQVLLADLCLRAEQGMLHDAGDVGPGIQELVDQSRTASPDRESVVAHTYAVPERGYALLLGLRSARAWAALRPRAIATALAALQRSFDVVIADCDGDFEGHDQGGSWDVEERNALSRLAVGAADAVVAVGLPGVKGVHSLGRLIADLSAAGVGATRIVPVFNRAGRGSRATSWLAKALWATVPPGVTGDLRPAVAVPQRDVERALHEGGRLPSGLAEPVVTAIAHAFGAAAPRAPVEEPAPRRIAPGELTTWTQELATS
jgi:hypothetical protein